MTSQVVTISSGMPQQWYYLQREFVLSLKDDQFMTLCPNHWGGLATKLKVLYHAIHTKLINTTHIIYVDSWDLVFASRPEEIMTRFFSFESDIVISSEQNCFPIDLKMEYDTLLPPTKYSYLNSGCIVGNVDAIFACLEAMDLPNIPDDHYDPIKGCNVHPNDQFEWQKIFLKQPAKIALDYNQQLSQTLHDASIEDFDLSGERIRNVFTNSYPCTFHFNGGAKSNLELRNPILQKLNLA